MKRKMLIIITAVLFAVTACNKKGNDQSAQIAELAKQLNEMQAELDKAKSANTAPEEIAGMEAVVAEVAQEEQLFGAQIAKMKDDTLAEMDSKLLAMQAVINTAKSANAAPEKIAILEDVFNKAVQQYRVKGDAEYQREMQIQMDEAWADRERVQTAMPSEVASAKSTAAATTTPTTATPAKNTTAPEPAKSTTAATTPAASTATTPTVSTATITPATVAAPATPTSTTASAAPAQTAPATAATTPKRGLTIEGTVVTKYSPHPFDSSTEPTLITIPDGVTAIGEGAFYRCEKPINVILSNSVTAIERSAFDQCYLTSITIPNSVTTIGSQAFNDTALTSVTIPDSVASIGANAFRHCQRLTSVTIGSGVTNFRGNVFDLCLKLTSVTFRGTIPASDEAFFKSHIGPFGSQGNLPYIYLAEGPGTYTRPSGSKEWTKQ